MVGQDSAGYAYMTIGNDRETGHMLPGECYVYSTVLFHLGFKIQSRINRICSIFVPRLAIYQSPHWPPVSREGIVRLIRSNGFVDEDIGRFHEWWILTVAQQLCYISRYTIFSHFTSRIIETTNYNRNLDRGYQDVFHVRELIDVVSSRTGNLQLEPQWRWQPDCFQGIWMASVGYFLAKLSWRSSCAHLTSRYFKTNLWILRVQLDGEISMELGMERRCAILKIRRNYEIRKNDSKRSKKHHFYWELLSSESPLMLQ